MPWKQTQPMSERAKFVLEAEEGIFSMTELCQRFGISRKTGYKWLGRHREKLLLSLTVFEMLGVTRALRSAERFRTLRKRGLTIPKTMDVIIATYCIEEDHPLLFSDRDFLPFVKHFGLRKAL